jgi:hypothetical protein
MDDPMILITRPVGVATGTDPDSGKPFIIAVMEDGSVWHTTGPDKHWEEGKPLQGTRRWNTWPAEENDRRKQDLESSNLESDWGA